MKRFLRNHVNALLAIFALMLLVGIIAYFGWGIGDIITEVNEANHDQIAGSPPPEFDLQSAASLDYRGTVAQPSASSS